MEEFLKYSDKWCKINNAEVFAIIYKDIAIGTISLSNQDIKNKKAKVGYWSGSKYWGKVYETKAFEKILEYARKKEIIYLSSKIKKNNIASRKIWENKGAKIEMINEYHMHI
ncbi:GNAT family N-acetyltransferase [Hathewaya limosa]|uniref:GNAT family N-acetyltransferase n=1 Tax=Hathewaya limosa TaxID=1536 RepID=UPI0027D8751B|nr:GNAT family N-acetyltransferase [Hathewaya limosa]